MKTILPSSTPIPPSVPVAALALFCCAFPGAISLLPAQEPADTNYDEDKVPDYTLPALLPEGMTGDAARAFWKESRRAEILTLFEENVYGRAPDVPVDIKPELIEQSDDALGGTAIRRQVRLSISPRPPAAADLGLDPGRSIRIDVLLYAPKNAAAKTEGRERRPPAFIGLNFYGNQTVHPDPEIRISEQWMRGNADIGIEGNRATEKTRGVYRERWQAEMLVMRGYGLVTAYYGDIDPDNYRDDFTDGVHPLFYKAGQNRPDDGEWGAIGAWAWGLSAIRRWLEEGNETDGAVVDARRLAVIGHSRLGKTALWAGAQDEKFAMVVSNDSGCGGAALYRRCYGERIHHMIKPVGYWFCRNHARFADHESELPVDQHMLLALVAPRPLYVASAQEDRWADPKGEFLSAKYASTVYEILGVEGVAAAEMPKADEPVGKGSVRYHMRSGDHDVKQFDWRQYLDFADKCL